MDQLKQHFEKGILAVAMLVMGYVAYTLYMDADEVQTKIQEQKGEREQGGTTNELGKIDMKPYTGALAKLEDTKPLTLSNPHNLSTQCSGAGRRRALCLRWRRVPRLARARCAWPRPTRCTPRWSSEGCRRRATFFATGLPLPVKRRRGKKTEFG